MTERYEGRNLSQLLDLMHDIVMPDPVAMTPQTDGWWVVLGWFVALLVLATIKYVRHRRRNRYRREALAELAHVDTDSSSATAEIAGIVKRTAMVAFPRTEVASLYGARWADFLVKTAGNDRRIKRNAQKLAEAPYKPGANASKIIRPAKRWVKVHRA